VNPTLRLDLFAVPQWSVGASQALPVPHGNFLWLLTYLALQNDWVERRELAALLWEDSQQGLNNLRQMLHRHKHLEYTGAIQTNRLAMRFVGICDVLDFRAAYSNADWQTALGLYRGDLLAQVRPQGVPEFATWLETERSTLQAEWLEVLKGQIEVLHTAQEHSQHFKLLQTLLEVDPYNEEAMLSLLHLAQPLEQEKKALQLFSSFGQRLRADLGVEPLPESIAAAEQLRSVSQSPTQQALLGRESEITIILEQLRHVRLLNIRGAGGMGKTMLAQQVLQQSAAVYVDGAFWVALQPITKLADVPLALAKALELTLQAHTDTWQQLSQFLQQKQVLLVLDNLEHLPELPSYLADLLENTEFLKILVTSRVALELPQESTFTLLGLDYPPMPNFEAMQHSNAVRLFVRQAAKRKAGFALTKDNVESIWRICRQLQGLPLGLMLSAAWVSELSPQTLAEDLEQNADVVALDDTTAAHSSLRMVFEHSWELLEDEWREALVAVSVFRGGFERHAAEGMGVRSRALLALVGRSLVQNGADGRFDLHPAVQSFAWQKLQSQEQQALQQKHTQHFLQLAERAEAPLCGGSNQIQMLRKISAEHQNLMALCDHNTDPEAVLRTLAALWRYFFIKDQMLEGLARLEVALQHATTTNLELLSRAELAAGVQSSVLGQFDGSNQWLQAALQHAIAAKSPVVQAQILNWQGTNLLAQGQDSAALHVLQEALSLQERLNHIGIINTCKDLGRVYAEKNDWEKAQPYFRRSLESAQTHQDLLGQSIALLNLAQTSQHLPTAKALLEQSMELKQKLGDNGGIALLLHASGMIALAEQDHASAQHHFLEALEIRVRHGRQREAAQTMLALAAVEFFANHFERAITLYAASWAALAQSHSTMSGFHTAMAQQLEAQARSKLPNELAAQAFQQGQVLGLEQAKNFAKQVVVQLEPAKEVLHV
jgi:predicted ATPase/DNA-binding SARP family transcriptional activator